MKCTVPNEPPFVFSCIPFISILTLWTIFLCNDYYYKYTILWYIYYVCPIAVFYIPIIRIPIKGFLLKPPTRYINCVHIRVVVSDIFYVHPYLGKIPILTSIFQMGWNHQPDIFLASYFNRQFNRQAICRACDELIDPRVDGNSKGVESLGFFTKNPWENLGFVSAHEITVPIWGESNLMHMLLVILGDFPCNNALLGLWKWWVFMFYTLED